MARRKCNNCAERAVERWRKKWWCRDCLCAEDPQELTLYRCHLGDITRQNEYGFNVAKFKKEIGRAMRRRGYKTCNWTGREK